MSNLILFGFNGHNDYDFLKKITNKLTRLALKNNKGIVFYFEGYGDDLIDLLNFDFYFSVSDDFFQLNSNFVTTEDIIDIETNRGKKLFIKKFKIFDKIAVYLKKEGINDFYFVTDICGVMDIEDFTTISLRSTNITEALYKLITDNPKETSYNFNDFFIKIILNP